MMDTSEFRKHGHELVDWMAEYLDQVASYPVRPTIKPGDIIARIPQRPPRDGEPFTLIFEDFKQIILPGMTHWQSPNFFAYFPANSSPESVLAEMLTATLGAQCMSWITSPAATELEERMMEWLREMTGLPEDWQGVIQDTASTATLCSLLTARESRTSYAVNTTGFAPSMRFTAYASSEAHSSVEKAIKIAGIGKENLRKIRVDGAFAMIPEDLEDAVLTDLQHGHIPLAVVAAVGTTGSTAVDPIRRIGEICRKHGIWLHIDAAFAGSALLLPDKRWMIDGIEYADSFVFNPHKWMFTNFDCSAYFVRDVDALVRTFEILPEYLKTSESDRVNNYRDWGIQLGRRFRALKLWFVIRGYGVKGLQSVIRHHIEIAERQAERIRHHPDFELLAPVPLNTICFRYHPSGIHDEGFLNRVNGALLESLNATGAMFLTHTKLNGRFTLRMVIGQTRVTENDVLAAWERIQESAARVRAESS